MVFAKIERFLLTHIDEIYVSKLQTEIEIEKLIKYKVHFCFLNIIFWAICVLDMKKRKDEQKNQE